MMKKLNERALKNVLETPDEERLIYIFKTLRRHAQKENGRESSLKIIRRGDIE